MGRKDDKMSGYIRQEGVVEQVDDDKMTVRIVCPSACGACGAKTLCGDGGKEKTVKVHLKEGERFLRGETVTVSGRTSQGALAVLMAFVFPLTGLLAVMAGGTWMEWGEMAVGAWCLLFVGGYFSSVYLLRHRLEGRFELSVQKENLI
jgi:sigma-E factor negative regulatory protein RseC